MTTEANGQGATSTTAPSVTTIAGQGSTGDIGISLAGPLSEENRGAIEAKGWLKDGKLNVDELAKSYRSLESEYSKSIRTPGENATPEEWTAFYGKMGRPETADKYELKLDANSLPESFPYDQTNAVEFRNWAHEAGLNPRQAQMLHDKFVGHQAARFAEMQTAQAKATEETHRALVSDWGDVETDGYKRNVELLSRAVRGLGLSEALAQRGVLGKDGSVMDATLAKALAKVGKELYAEDKMLGGANGTVNNPWSQGKENLTEQGRIFRSDPKLAKSLIQAAGLKPAQYGL